MAEICLAPSGKVIATEPGDTVLGALERAGYALPNNCRAGACGECKVKVLSGAFDQGMVLDMALSPEERAAGFGLMCMAKPTGDRLVIEWGTADAKPKLFPPQTRQPFVVTERVALTPRIVELRLRPIGATMRYWPGQYLVVGDAAAGAPPRCYSIANAPRTDGEIMLQVARVDGGATSTWLCERVREGDQVSVDGPYGVFIGDPSIEAPVLCLAAGTGLAPILALTEAALRRNYSAPVMLVVSVRTATDLYGTGLMSYWRARHRNFDFRITTTRAPADGHLRGRVPAILPSILSSLAAHNVFIAGGVEFARACEDAVKDLGADPARVFSERYVAQALPESPPSVQLTI